MRRKGNSARQNYIKITLKKIKLFLDAFALPFDLKDTDTNIPDDIFGMSLDDYTGDYINADVNFVNTTHTRCARLWVT